MIGAAGNGSVISGTLTNGTSSPQTATYMVTPSAANCTGSDFMLVVTVNPTPTVSFSIPNQTLCSGGTSQPVTISSPTAGASIAWTMTLPVGITAVPATTNGTTLIPAYTFTNSTAVPVTISFVTTVSTAGTPSCPGVGGTYSITVVPTPPPPATQPLVEYCHNEPPTALTATATPPNTLIWYSPPNYTPSTTAPTPSTAVVGSFIYYVTQVSPTTPACESPRATIEVRVKPIPQIAVNAVPPTTCNSNNGAMTISGLFPNTVYQVHYVVNTVVVNSTATSNAAGNIVINNLVGGIYRDIWVILNGCRSNVVAGPFNLVNPDVPATPDAGSNSPICEGATLQLNAVSLTPNVTYEWTGPNGYTSALSNPQIVNATINRTGRYKVVARANGCVSEADSIDVVVHPNPTVNLGPDLQLLPPAQQVLNPIITNGPISQYTWTPTQNLSCSNCPNPTVTVLSTNTYQLTVRNNNGCVGKDDIHITALCERSLVYIPNAFVPNGGANSVFRIRSAGSLVVKHFRIFNRWGELIFERTNFPTNDAAYGWDGRINGTLVNPDVFVYTAEVQCENGSLFTFKGNVTLLR
jgi:gliding motility-associated-like protein